MRRVSILSMALLFLLSCWIQPYSEARILKRGMRGDDVESLQTFLYDLGHKLTVDGIFGWETEKLIKEIQKNAGLIADGIVGRETEVLLEELGSDVVRYKVEQGDNLTHIAKRYGTTVRTIMDYNGLANPDRLLVGQELYIPALSVVTLNRLKGMGSLQWPLKGKITSGYGHRFHPITKKRHFHAGIDIAASEGTPVKAAASGKVIKAGSLGNYGLAVVIDHGGNLTTWYGHNSKLHVRVGESVQQGQVIAQVGQTGQATGPHLDFRIKIGEQTMPPLEWLP